MLRGVDELEVFLTEGKGDVVVDAIFGTSDTSLSTSKWVSLSMSLSSGLLPPVCREVVSAQKANRAGWCRDYESDGFANGDWKLRELLECGHD